MLTVALATLGGPAHAEELTLEQALTLSIEGNQTVRNARYQVESAAGGVLSAQAQFDPNLALGGGLTNSLRTQFFGSFIFDQDSVNLNGFGRFNGTLPTGTSYTVEGTLFRQDTEQVRFPSQQDPEFRIVDAFTARPQFAVTLSQNLLRGHRWAFNRRAVVEAETSLTVAELQLLAQEQRTLRDVAQAWWGWWFQTRAVEIAQDRVDVAQEALRIGELQLQEGRIAPVDVSRLRTELVRARSALTDATQLAAERRDAVLVLMGQEPGQEVSTGDAAPPPPMAPPDAADAMATARENNLDLRVARRQQEQADLSLRMARHGLLPSLSVDASAEFSQVTNKVGADPEEVAPNNNFNVSGTFSMPLGNRAARGEVARAAATEAQRRNDLAAQERTVLSEVARQARLLEAADLQIELADQEVVLAEQTLKAEEARAEVGRAVQRDVLEARVAVFDARLQAARARSDRQLARIELLLLQGQLDIAAATGQR